MSGSHSGEPRLKKTKFEKEIDININSSHQLTLEVMATTSLEPTHDLNNGKSQTALNGEQKLLEGETIVQQLTEELHKQKQKSIVDQTVFIKTLSDLQTFNSGKQQYLEATITGLQRELKAEKQRTSKQTHAIQSLTIASNCAINRADSLQCKLLETETELHLSKTRFELEQQDLAIKLKDKDSQIKELNLQLKAVSSSNQIQQENDHLKANLLRMESQLKQALQDNQSLRQKYEPAVIDLSDSDTEGTTEQRRPLPPVKRQFREYLKFMGPNDDGCDACCFHPILPVLAFRHLKNVAFFTATCGSAPFSKWVDSKDKYECLQNITVLAWNVDGTQLAAGCELGSVFVWSYPAGKMIFKMEGHSSRLTEIEWNPFNSFGMATRDNKGIEIKKKILLWDSSTCATKRILFTLEFKQVHTMKWLAKNLIAFGDKNGVIQIYELDQSRSAIRVIKALNHGEAICAMHLMNEEFLASCSKDKFIRIWNIRNYKVVVDYRQLNCACNCIAWRPIGNPNDDLFRKSPETLTVVGGLVDGSIIIWNPFGKNEIKMLKQYSEPVTSVSFSPDGKFLASSSITDQVIVWSTETWVSIFVGSHLNEFERRHLHDQFFSWLLVKSTEEGDGRDAYKLVLETWNENIHVIENV